MITHASLFSGIGGAEIAAAWMGWENLFHCDINPFGLQVLRYWFPKSKEYNDIKTTDFTPWRGKVDVLTGGFPCQPFSSVGRRKGAEDDRYLWPQMLRAIDEVKPRYVVGENVAGITTMVEQAETTKMANEASLFDEDGVFEQTKTVKRYTVDRICRDIEEHGYAVQPLAIPAIAVDAPHVRERVWFLAKRRVADTVRVGEQDVNSFYDFFKGESVAQPQRVDGKTNRHHGERVSPSPREADGDEARDVPPNRGFEAFPSQSPLRLRDDGLPDRMADAPLYEGSAEKWIKGCLHGLGNAWCPQVAFEIFKAIQTDIEG